MPISVMLYKVIISCPSDVQEEISVIYKTLDDVNHQFGEILGIRLEPVHWSKDVFISYGSPQKLINEQIVTSSDIIIAVFNQKLGSPTEHYDSGTLEELAIMIEAGRQTFVCFSDKPIKPSQIDYKNWKKVNEFRKTYSKRGLYLSYNSEEDLGEKLFQQLRLYLQHLSKETAEPISSKIDGWGQHVINHEAVHTQYNAQGQMIINTLCSDKEK